MGKDKILAIIIVILSLIITVTSMISNYSLKRKHKKEIKFIEDKYLSLTEDLHKEYNKLEEVYKQREEDNQEYKERYEELKNEVSIIEDMINTEPEIISNKLSYEMQMFMREVENETN